MWTKPLLYVYMWSTWPACGHCSSSLPMPTYHLCPGPSRFFNPKDSAWYQDLNPVFAFLLALSFSLATWHSAAECCKHSQDTSWIPKDRNLESVTHHLNVAFLHFQLDLQPSPLSSSIHSRCGSCAHPLTLGLILHLVPPSQELSRRHPPALRSLRGRSVVSPEPSPQLPNLPWLSQLTEKGCRFLEP